MLGYSLSTDGDDAKPRYGPQTYEDLISELCAAFGCVPSVAEAEYARDPVLIHGIFDCRNARSTLSLMEAGDAGAKAIQQHPECMQIIGALRAAQDDED